MKTLLKVLGIVLAVVIVLFGTSYLFISQSGIPSYDTSPLTVELEYTAEKVARGKKLALMLCSGCHLNTTTATLAGAAMTDVPVEFGKVYAPNITQDKQYGIGEWSDGELIYLLRTGIKKDGKYAPPYMAKLPGMADDDIESIIAFLRSDDPLVKADPTPDKPCEPSFLTKMLCRIEFKPLPMPNKVILMPDTADQIAFGKYLAQNLDCYSCHSADYKTNNYLQPERSEGYFGGGNQPLSKEGKVMFTSNLTPDKETGIGSWSEEQFVRAVRFGLIENEPGLRFPMMPYAQLTDYEAGAIFAYLQTIPAIHNEVPRSSYD